MRIRELCTPAIGMVLVLVSGCYRYVTSYRPLTAAECGPSAPPGGFLEQERDPMAASAVHGRVVGIGTSQDGEVALPDALVSIPQLRRGVYADANGQFRLDSVPAGAYRVVTRRIGFGMRQDSISVNPGAGVRVRIALAPQPLDGDCSSIVVAERRRAWRWPWQ